MIDRERLLDVLRIDFDSGRFYWKKPSKYHARKEGREAGHVAMNHSGKSYWVIRIDGIKYKRGRLMFLAINGRLPYPCIDHINGDSLDDRPDNLREATVTENAWNHKGRKKKSDTPMGVRKTRNGKYHARIAVNKTTIHIGSFDSAESASAAYQDKRKELYGQFA